MHTSHVCAWLGIMLAWAGLLISPCFAQETDPLLPVPDEIRAEATRSNADPVGRPLPLAAHWNVGVNSEPEVGFPPSVQMDLIAQGHYLLPWFGWPDTDDFLNTTFPDKQKREKYFNDCLPYYEAAMKKAAALHLPISFISTQWESTLSYDKKYLDLPPEKNPNVVDIDGKILPEVDPFGPVAPWREVGAQWSASRLMAQLEAWYPDPPLVVLISNNEHNKLWWVDAEKSKRYIDLYGKGRDDNFKRKIIADGWIERYRALQQGMREGLVNPAWQQHALFLGYGAFGPPHFGRDMGKEEDWLMYSDYSPGRIDSGPLMWDGGSPSYYLHNWSPITDYQVWSPQIESMNWIFMQKEALKENPNFWFEISTWDGDVGDQPNNKRKTYASQGQTLSPERYEGMIQFGMWLLRPRVVRDFRGWLEQRKNIEPYFAPIMDAVDRVHTNPVLRRFWRKGELVANHAHQHPYQTLLPDELKTVDRWFLLDTNLDAPWPWTNFTEIPVFSLALVMGQAPEREWLVYAHAPKGARTGVKVTLPEYGQITIDASLTGSFYLVSEKTRAVATLLAGGPASVGIAVKSPFVNSRERVAFSAVDAYEPYGKLRQFTWDFGDKGQGKGAGVTHVYRQPGLYTVQLKASDGMGTETTQTKTIFAGIPRPDGQVLHYLLQQHAGDFIPDASGHNHGGLGNGLAWVVDTQRGAVLDLDGKQQYVAIMNSPELNTAGNLPNRTVALCFKAVDVTKRQVLYEEGGPGAGMNLYIENGKLHGGAWCAGIWKGTWLDGQEVTPGQWYHVALVLNDGGATPAPDKLALFQNGVQVASGAAAWLTSHGNDICLGRSGDTNFPSGASDAPGQYFAGRISDLQIYNRALTAQEIARL